jgi:hypothetical protein
VSSRILAYCYRFYNGPLFGGTCRHRLLKRSRQLFLRLGELQGPFLRDGRAIRQSLVLYHRAARENYVKHGQEDSSGRQSVFGAASLQNIGQQEVLTKELYAGNAEGPTGNDVVFGYQNRYDEYRWHESYVSGEFRNILNSWHMARDFANAPVLNADFINAVPTTRIFAAQQNDTLYCMANHSIQARRLMSKYGNPI